MDQQKINDLKNALNYSDNEASELIDVLKEKGYDFNVIYPERSNENYFLYQALSNGLDNSASKLIDALKEKGYFKTLSDDLKKYFYEKTDFYNIKSHEAYILEKSRKALKDLGIKYLSSFALTI